MKKFLSMMALAMMVMTSLTFVSCGDDENEDDGGKSSQTLKVNGEVWQPSTENPPRYHGVFTGDDTYAYGIVFSTFTRKEKDMADYVSPSTISFDFATKFDGAITKGMDLGSSDVLQRAAGNTEIGVSSGVLGEADYWGATYDGKAIRGTAVVVDLKEKDFITIRFSNCTFGQRQDAASKNAPETVTLDGTVTYKYSESLYY